MEKIRVFMVIAAFFPYIGGAEKQAYRLAEELIKHGVDVKILTGRWAKNLKKFEKIGNVEILRIFSNLFSFWSRNNIEKGIFYIKQPKKNFKLSYIISFIISFLEKLNYRFCIYLYQCSLFFNLLLKKNNYDIIHVHQVLYPAFISTLCGKILKKPVIAKVGNSGSNSDIIQIKKFPEGKIQLKYILNNITKIVCTTNKMKEEFLYEGIKNEKLVLIRNGVNILDFYRNYNNCKNFVFIGRFIRNKNIKTLIYAFSILPVEIKSKITLYLIGDGPDRDKIYELIKKLGIKNNVVFTGMIENVEEFLKKCDIFILPSLVEGLSNSLIEAISYKLPCIVSNVPANLEVLGINSKKILIEKGSFKKTKYGLIFNPLDIRGLANSIIYLFENENVRREIGEKGYLKIKKEFNISIISESYIKLYKEILFNKVLL